ncbi:uncharacterized protein PV07_01149 [Cladophialophora immunda]|uniref:Nephrocystin 3-like N-terminal domain-containing protein n=1 Tax=Cladophialophora immunda TaxID=569365 RepID=A0A0D2CWY2_9EURO|nr:uncharacterized protein PV07_01149 [Cladophialophora immunda]KIW34370.1 hypothetical protein PV07_01149 [Cladophialophora immunda]
MSSSKSKDVEKAVRASLMPLHDHDSSQVASTAPVVEVHAYHRQLFTWLAEELQSITNSVMTLKPLMFHSEFAPKSRDLLDDTKEALGQEKAQVQKSLLDIAAQRSGVKYADLVSKLEHLKSILSSLNDKFGELRDLDPGRMPNRNKLVVLARIQRSSVRRAQLLATVEMVQSRFQAVDKSLEALLPSMMITAALEQEHSVEVQKLREELQILAVTEAPANTRSYKLDAKSHPTSPRWARSEGVARQIKQILPSIDHRFNTFRDLMPNGTNLARHQHYQRIRSNGTCDWLISSKEFWEEWLHAKHGTSETLFCWGEPGTGKSILASRAIDVLFGIRRVCAYYYIGNCVALSAERLALSLLCQLCDLGPDFSAVDTHISSQDPRRRRSDPKSDDIDSVEVLPPVCDSTLVEEADGVGGPCLLAADLAAGHGTGDAKEAADVKQTESPKEGKAATATKHENFTNIWSLKTSARATARPPLQILLDALGKVISSIGGEESVFIVLDAWDENNMECVGDFYAILGKLYSLNCKLFLTSREEPDSRTPFGHIPVHIDESRNCNDVESVVREQLDSLNLFEAVPGPQAVENLPGIVAQTSRGVFTAAILRTNHLRSMTVDISRRPPLAAFQPLFSPIRSLIKRIQGKGKLYVLDDIIKDYLTELQKSKPSIALPLQLTLVWVGFAEPPLAVRDLNVAIPKISNRIRNFSIPLSQRMETITNDSDMDVISSWLAGLIVIDPGTSLMRLLSDPVKTAIASFLSTSIRLPVRLDIMLGEICIYCIRYLLQIETGNVDLRSEIRTVELLRTEPFLAHAALSWGTFYRRFYELTTAPSLGPEKDVSQYAGREGKAKERAIAANDPNDTESIEAAETNTEANERGEEAATAAATKENDSTLAEPSTQMQEKAVVFNPPPPDVSSHALEMFENREKITLAVIMAMYLSNDPTTLPLSWEELYSWVNSMSDLHIASRLGLTLPVKNILKADRLQLSVQDEQGRTPLHEAASGGFQDVARILVEAGAQLVLKDKTEKTPLDLAMAGKHYAVFALLFEKLVESQKKDITSEIDGASDLIDDYCLCICGDQKPRQRMLDLTLIHAIDKHNIDIAELLLDHGANPNCWDDSQTPVMHHAIFGYNRGEGVKAERDPYRQADYSEVDLLLMYGADPSLKSLDKQGQSALHVAVRCGNSAVVRKLLRHGADLSIQDSQGLSALSAMFDGPPLRIREVEYMIILKSLLLRGADLDQEDHEGRRALHLAALNGHIKALILLIEMGASRDPKDKHGQTPLESAEKGGNEEAVKILKHFTSYR